MGVDMDDFWVFGYGSLMWRPGFEHEEMRPARLFGYHRALCVRSFVHRGTPERPGLVLGLDRGGSCRGMAFRVSGRNQKIVTDYLRARELVTRVYVETFHRVRLEDSRPVDAMAYIVDRSHAQYAGAITVAEAVDRVRGAVGQSGPNEAYVLNTVAHLQAMGIRDHHLEEIAAAIDPGTTGSDSIDPDALPSGRLRA